MQNENNLTLMFILWNVGMAFSLSFIFPYLFTVGFSVQEMLFFAFLNYAFPLIFLIILRNYDSAISMPLGMFFVALAYFLFVFLGGVAGVIALFAIGALSFFLFWVPFNHFWFSMKKQNAAHSTIYAAIIIVVGLIMPALSGAIAQEFGFAAIFLSSAIILLFASLISLKLAPKKKVSLNLAVSLKELDGFKTLFFIEGVHHIAPFVLITIISIYYFPRPVDFGIFMSLAMVLSVVSSFIFAKSSDRSGNRRNFIILFAIILGISTVFASFASDILFWFIAVSFVNFARVLFFPFPLSLMLDKRQITPGIMYSREIMLNLGRSFSAIFSLGLYLLTLDLRIPLLVTGLSMFLYVLIFEFMKNKKINCA
ncbi:MAG: MFS transporter [Candidatus Micrarchaeota archaeon]